MDKLTEDTFKHKGWRMEMVRQLGEKGIGDRRVLDAMAKVPRHLFLDTMLDYMAYEDRALPIKCGQTISQPSTVAFQSELLDAEPEMKVLEVGTGSGYQTAVLCDMGLKVFTIERQKELFDITKMRLDELHYRPKCFLGDGYKGLPEYAPFDRIIITCGAPEVPEALLAQLQRRIRWYQPLKDSHRKNACHPATCPQEQHCTVQAPSDRHNARPA